MLRNNRFHSFAECLDGCHPSTLKKRDGIYGLLRLTPEWKESSEYGDETQSLLRSRITTMNTVEIAQSCSVNNDMTWQRTFPLGFQDMLEFGFIEALTGRRARRFFMGAEIPDGVLA